MSEEKKEKKKVGRGFKPGVSGNPGGRPKKFVTLLSDALREKLGEVDAETTKTYATVIADGLVEGAAAEAKKGQLTKELMWAVNLVADRTEGRPAQKVTLVDDPDSNPAKRIAELLARAAERVDSAFSDR